jgi:prepilin-type N-terminal cleavage/methylation domain-containing protein
MRALRPKAPVAGLARGFTVVELMVAVAIIGVVSSVLFTVSQDSWRRERANAATLELAAWLDQISRSPEQNGVSCQVTVNTGTLAPGAVLASVTPTNCATEANLRLPGINITQNFQVAATGGLGGPGTSQWWFTPRGAISTTAPATNTGSSATDISVRISVAGQAPVRCVRLSGTLGLQRMGRNNASGDPNNNCTDWSVR